MSMKARFSGKKHGLAPGIYVGWVHFTSKGERKHTSNAVGIMYMEPAVPTIVHLSNDPAHCKCPDTVRVTFKHRSETDLSPGEPFLDMGVAPDRVYYEFMVVVERLEGAPNEFEIELIPQFIAP